MDWYLIIISILISVLTIIFWLFFFALFCLRFWKIKKSHVKYSFKDGMSRNRCSTSIYYLSNIGFRVMISLFVGFSAFVEPETQVTFWCIAFLCAALNMININVFRNFIENLNHNVSNMLLVWVTFYCTCLIGIPEVRISRERQAKGLIFVYIIVLGSLCIISILASLVKIVRSIRKGIWKCRK